VSYALSHGIYGKELPFGVQLVHHVYAMVGRRCLYGRLPLNARPCVRPCQRSIIPSRMTDDHVTVADQQWCANRMIRSALLCAAQATFRCRLLAARLHAIVNLLQVRGSQKKKQIGGCIYCRHCPSIIRMSQAVDGARKYSTESPTMNRTHTHTHTPDTFQLRLL